MRTEEQNRLQAPTVPPPVKEAIEAILIDLDREIKRVDREIAQLFDRYPPLRWQRDLLTSIPGTGSTTAALILGEMPNIVQFRGVKAVAAYAGLPPRHYESGSIRSPSNISKTATLTRAQRSIFRRLRPSDATLLCNDLRSVYVSAEAIDARLRRSQVGPLLRSKLRYPLTLAS